MYQTLGFSGRPFWDSSAGAEEEPKRIRVILEPSKIISLKIINGEMLNEREEKFVSIKLNL